MHDAPPFEALLSTPDALRAFGQQAVVAAMLRFEAALARAQAAVGLVPGAAAEHIAAQCDVAHFDVPQLLAASAHAGSLAIPLVQALRERVAAVDATAAAWVHHGATSQDAIDTAVALQTQVVGAALDADAQRLVAALRALAQREAHTPALARTLMQPASATTLGLKVLSWAEPIAHALQRVQAQARDAMQVQLGGAVGTLAVMGERGPTVRSALAQSLGLADAGSAWHSQRESWVALACAVGVLVGACGKMARDWSLMMQAEVGELSEPQAAGRGASSAMAHKHNPVAAMVALAAAQRVPQRVAALLACMPQEHERALGAWQAELAEWAGLWISAAGAVRALADAAPGLVVHHERLRANLEAHRGVFEIDRALAAARRTTDLALQHLEGMA
jgi:3-carboxy-cis,cis-muconate cycloisomerase